MRIEDELDTAVVFAREFADHQRTGTRGGFPVHMARAVRGEVIPQGIEILAATFCEAFQRSLQTGQDLQVFSSRFHVRVDQRFRFQVELARFTEEAKWKTSD